MTPVHAILLVAAFASLLGLVNVGSMVAFNALTSVALMGHYLSYLLPITLLVFRRFGKSEIPWGPWTLGRWGLLVNLIAISYATVLVVFMVFPPYQPVTAQNMNYASLIFGAVMLLSITMWFAYGRKIYYGPVRDVIEELYIK